MKRITLILTSLLLAATCLFAQNPEEQPFLGTWDLTVSGTPMGDFSMPLTVSYNDGKLVGTVSSPEGSMAFDSLTVKEDKLVAAVTAQDFGIEIELALQEDGTLSGMVMDQFPITGKKREQN